MIKIDRRSLEKFLVSHPWIKEPMFRIVGEYGDVSEYVLMHPDIREDDDLVKCLRGLSPKQKIILRGKLRCQVKYWDSQYLCDKEAQLASIALLGFEREDYTLGVIYRYINEMDIAESLKY